MSKVPTEIKEHSMGTPLAFISYRRADASQAAQGLHVQLRDRFGPSRIFMDVGAISVGDVWPDRLRRALEKATVLLVVIGPGWLTAADRFGRRRLDQPVDWVRSEILYAIESRKRIFPLLGVPISVFQERDEVHAVRGRARSEGSASSALGKPMENGHRASHDLGRRQQGDAARCRSRSVPGCVVRRDARETGGFRSPVVRLKADCSAGRLTRTTPTPSTNQEFRGRIR